MIRRIAFPEHHRELFGALHRLLNEEFTALPDRPPEHRAGAWLVGGYLRDVLLGRVGDDIDLAVDGPATELARRFADATGGAFVRLDEATDTARVVWKHTAGRPLVLDLARLRAAGISADLRLRDLSINALALPLELAVAGEIGSDELIDAAGGLADLQAQVLRLCNPNVFVDDPLRTLRTARLGAQLGFELLPQTDRALRAAAALIVQVAHERVRDELWKLLATPRAAPWLAYLDDARLLTAVLPELEASRDCAQPPEHFLPVLGHLLETVAAAEWLSARLGAMAGQTAPESIRERRRFALPEAARVYPLLPAALPFAERLVAGLRENAGGYPRLALLKLGALLHDIGKPRTRQAHPDGRITFYGHDDAGAELAADALRRLRFPKDAVAYVRLLVAEHMRPGQLRGLGSQLTERAVIRLLRDTGDAAPDVLLLAICDHMAVRGPMLEWDWWIHHLGWTGAMLEYAWSARREAHEHRLINGDDVLALGVASGPRIGRVLAAVREAQDAGEVRTRDEALALAAQLAGAVR